MNRRAIQPAMKADLLDPSYKHTPKAVIIVSSTRVWKRIKKSESSFLNLLGLHEGA